MGAILAPGKRTVSSVLRALGLGQQPNFQRYHRVLNRAVWSARQAAQLLLGLLISTFAPSGPLLFGLDETIERRWGAQIKARGIYRDAARSSKSVLNKTSGLRWLSVQLLTRVPWAEHLWALPFLTILAPSRRYYQKQGKTPKTLLKCAGQALLKVKRWCPKRLLIFFGDATYAALELLALAQKLQIAFVTPLRLDAALYEPVQPRQPHQIGRTRRKGQPVPKLTQVLADPKTRWQRVKLLWYGYGSRLVELTTGTAVLFHKGMTGVSIRWVLVRDPQGEFDTRALLSTDSTLSAQQILEYYTRRWQVEVTFEMRHEVVRVIV